MLIATRLPQRQDQANQDHKRQDLQVVSGQEVAARCQEWEDIDPIRDRVRLASAETLPDHSNQIHRNMKPGRKALLQVTRQGSEESTRVAIKV